jgi:hypothetical protein
MITHIGFALGGILLAEIPPFPPCRARSVTIRLPEGLFRKRFRRIVILESATRFSSGGPPMKAHWSSCLGRGLLTEIPPSLPAWRVPLHLSFPRLCIGTRFRRIVSVDLLLNASGG